MGGDKGKVQAEKTDDHRKQMIIEKIILKRMFIGVSSLKYPKYIKLLNSILHETSVLKGLKNVYKNRIHLVTFIFSKVILNITSILGILRE